MCGIAGFVTVEAHAGSETVLRRMTGRIRHRGPDDAGFYCDAHAFLGHRRLSIVDLAGGHQPMSNESGTLWITYNGEIFNHAELRPELERAGHVYASRSDTETILHAYEEYGAACVSRFRGMFALAVWDGARKTLYCVRDRLGIKPFYYFWNGQMFAFASEIKALLEHPAISASFEESILAEYLGLGYVSGEQTFFRGIRKLMPGHFLRLDLTGESPQPKFERYWDVPPPGENPADQDWVRETWRRLEETVRMRLMSDVPLGVFLSGGVDSSAIAALVKGMADGPVQTFSVGYRESEFSELDFARQAARAIGTEHHEITLGREEFFAALPTLIWHEDEPIAWPSSVSLYFVSRLASERVKVVLTGEGADELFGGYSRYRHYLQAQPWAGAWQRVPASLRRAVASGISSSGLLSAGLRRKLQHTFLGREFSVESLYLENFYAGFAPGDIEALFPSASGLGGRYSSFLAYWNSRERSPLSRMLYADQKTYLVELLMKQDQMSMACSIESRVPFLDHPFVEFSVQVPDRLKIRNGTTKYILKEAVRDLLPAEVLDRKKMGFPTPLRPWLRHPATQPLIDSLLDRDGLLASLSDQAALTALIERHRAGRQDATDPLWRLINLQLWGDLFLTGRRDRWMAPAVLAAQ